MRRGAKIIPFRHGASPAERAERAQLSRMQASILRIVNMIFFSVLFFEIAVLVAYGLGYFGATR